VKAIFETERLRFRVPGGEEAAEVARFYRDNRDHLQPWSPTFPLVMFGEGFWGAELARRRADVDAGGDVRGFIFTRDLPCRIIGNLSLTSIVRGVLQGCTLGYSLAAEAQGHGYMVEAVRGAVGFAFGSLRLHRVSAGYMPRNQRSAAVLRQAGFVIEGYARDYLFINGRWEDHVLAAAVNPAWKQ
jgi:ribosomal-protein-alanine N-acetyltransferase